MDTLTAKRGIPRLSRIDEKPSHRPPGPAKRSITGVAPLSTIGFVCYVPRSISLDVMTAGDFTASCVRTMLLSLSELRTKRCRQEDGISTCIGHACCRMKDHFLRNTPHCADMFVNRSGRSTRLSSCQTATPLWLANTPSPPTGFQPTLPTCLDHSAPPCPILRHRA